MPLEASRGYIGKRKKLSGIFYETALPNEYLVEIGRKDIRPVLGGRRFRLFKKFIRVPAYVQTLYFVTDNANVDYQGIGIEGFASWRIDPASPKMAITTLDFFDEEDPMAKTNQELKTICVEAVRHVISNMTIEDAMRKKEEIAENLKIQLKEVEAKWGIIFDQVGIEKVTVMSASLFENLQAEFRDKLRLDVERNRINTDKQIISEENVMKEKTELEKLDTDKKIQSTKLNNSSSIKKEELEQHEKIVEQERRIKEEAFRKELVFNTEKEKKEYEFSLLQKQLELELQKTEIKRLEEQKNIEMIKNTMEENRLKIEQLKKQLSQYFTDEALLNAFIENIPSIFSSMKIDHYSVMSGSDGGISPVTKVLGEVINLLKTNDIGGLFKKIKETKKN